MKIKRKVKMIFIFLFLLFVYSSGFSAQNVSENPEKYYNEAVMLIDGNSLSEAESKLNAALSIDKKYSPAYEGLGSVYFKQGDIKKSKKNFKKAIRYDKHNVKAYTGLGELYISENDLNEAEDIFHKLMKKNKDKPEGYYYKGMVIEKEGFAYEQKRIDKFKKKDEDYFEKKTLKILREAKDLYKEALVVDDSFKPAQTAWEKLDLILNAGIGSQEAIEIAMTDEIKRYQVATLLISELKLDKIIKPEEKLEKRNIPDATDYTYHRRSKYIERIIPTGVMLLFSNYSFLPDRVVKRKEFAEIVNNILLRIGDVDSPKLDVKSEFPDVPSSSPYYSSVKTAAIRGILESDLKTGAFRPDDSLKGAELLIAIRKLKSIIK